MSSQAVYHVAYVATWKEELEPNVLDVETAIRSMSIEKPFDLNDLIQQAANEIGVKKIDNFVLIGITEFDDQYDYEQFFKLPVKG
jgi:hypothetical protein